MIHPYSLRFFTFYGHCVMLLLFLLSSWLGGKNYFVKSIMLVITYPSHSCQNTNSVSCVGPSKVWKDPLTLLNDRRPLLQFKNDYAGAYRSVHANCYWASNLFRNFVRLDAWVLDKLDNDWLLHVGLGWPSVRLLRAMSVVWCSREAFWDDFNDTVPTSVQLRTAPDNRKGSQKPDCRT